MDSPSSYRTNRDLFSNHYLDEHLPDTEAWDQLTEDELRDAKNEILDLWEREKNTAPKRNESQLEERFIRPMFRKLGIPFEVEESTSRTQRRPDYAFFRTDAAAKDAFNRREEGGDFYQNAVAVADAKRWGRPLDTRGSAEHERDFENPSYQIHVYLQETPTRWAVLTDGKRWRLYYGPTSHRLDSYYEVELPTILEDGNLDDFKYFYLFFRHEAFVEDSSGDCFLDDVYDESNVFAQELGADLQDNIYEAIKILSEGFLQYTENELSEDDLELIHDSSLIYLYRIIFVLYAEAEGRELLNTSNEIYEESYSLNSLKQEIADELDSADPKYRAWQTKLWTRLDDLFQLIDQGSKSRGIPEEDLYIPAYDGGLFRTDPDESDSEAAQFLAQYQVGDAYLAEVIGLLTRSENGNGGSKIFVDYSSLDVRHLGSIYEGLLEYQLNIADEPHAIEDGEYVPADESAEIEVSEGEVYLTTGSGKRKATGSYYTPEYVVEYIVESTLGPIVQKIREDLAGQSGFGEGGFAGEFADQIFRLKVLDPAMGSGHFLTSAVDYLAREIIDAQERQAAQEGIESVDEDQDINWARRQVAQKCIYGVDLNPLAVELAKVSLWLRTLAAEQPLAFLDHHLKTGNSLVGSDIEEVLDNGDPDSETEDGQLTLHQSFARTRRQALDHVTDRFQALLAIDNETLEEIKEMEEVFEEVRDDPLYQHLLAMANVYTADAFGLDVPADAYERMAEALRDETWEGIEGQDWFDSAQSLAESERFFHWELEFPVAFYGEDGDREEDAGFDAVIGNPPWVSFGLRGVGKLTDQEKTYYKENFGNSAEYKISTYALFMELGIRLTREEGRHSYIVPDSFLIGQYFSKIRSYILEKSKIESINLILEDFWEGDIGRSVIYVLENYPDSEETNEMEISLFETLNDFMLGHGQTNTYSQSFFHQTELKRFRLLFETHDKQFVQQMEDTAELEVGDVMGIHTGVRSRIGQKNIQSKEKKGESWKKGLVSSSQVVRYNVQWEGHYLNIDPELLWSGGWDPEVVEQDKILIRQTGDRIIAGLDKEKLYHLNNLHSAVLESKDIDIRYLLTLLNSAPLLRYYTLTTLELGRSMAQTDIETLLKLPIKEISFKHTEDERSQLVQKSLSEIENSEAATFIPPTLREEIDAGYLGVAHDVLCELSDELSKLAERRRLMNVNLYDYIRDFEPGPKLKDVPGYQPHSGVSRSIMAETTEDRIGLRVNSLHIEEKGAKVVGVASARFKPEGSSDRDVDPYGFVSTEEMPVMEFVDPPRETREIIKEFVPYVVNQAEEGFADFRSKATKTNSPLDRIEEIQLPEPESISEELDRYLARKQDFNNLDREFKRKDALTNNILLTMYNLDPEQFSTSDKQT